MRRFRYVAAAALAACVFAPVARADQPTFIPLTAIDYVDQTCGFPVAVQDRVGEYLWPWHHHAKSGWLGHNRLDRRERRCVANSERSDTRRICRPGIREPHNRAANASERHRAGQHLRRIGTGVDRSSPRVVTEGGLVSLRLGPSSRRRARRVRFGVQKRTSVGKGSPRGRTTGRAPADCPTERRRAPSRTPR
jgi:hypothetical protein